jgi:NAD(P)H-flavin reductase
LLVAAGTSPNVIYEREHPGSFDVDARARAFRAYRAVRPTNGGGDGVRLEPAAPGEVAFFTSYARGGRFITFYGDNHPVYAGSVVKAMASAKDGYPHVAALFAPHIAALDPREQPARDGAWEAFAGRLDRDLRATVHEVIRLTPTIVEVVVAAPAAARRFQPGQFYRLQNFETLSPLLDGPDGHGRRTRLQMEGLALTGASVDLARGLVSLIVLEMGSSSRLCARLRPGEPVVLMGPTGAPTEIPRGEAVALCGGGLGNAVLFSIARALRDNGCRVLYFAGYRKREDIYKVGEIEAATDEVIWSVDTGELPVAHRPQDKVFRGNIVQAMTAHASGELGPQVVPLSDCRRIIAIGSDRMMAAVTRARHGVLRPHLQPEHVAIASINSPMQCMMKEVCAQCLQRQIDPATGKEVFVFSCFNQDQAQDRVDWGHLAERLGQNTVQEKLSDLWTRRLMASV